MRIIRFVILSAIFQLCAFMRTEAATNPVYEPVDTAAGIFKAIADSNTAIIIFQDDVLSSRLLPTSVIRSSWSPDKKEVKSDPLIKYRIQVYSDNNRQTAKANAEYRKRLVEQRIPEIQGYVTYDAPYWRVRVGDFQSESEALAAMKMIKSKFPAFASDIRIVKVRVK